MAKISNTHHITKKGTVKRNPLKKKVVYKIATIRPVPKISDEDPRFEDIDEAIYEYDFSPDSKWQEVADMVQGPDPDKNPAVKDSMWNGNALSLEATEEYIVTAAKNYERAIAIHGTPWLKSVAKIDIEWDYWIE